MIATSKDARFVVDEGRNGRVHQVREVRGMIRPALQPVPGNGAPFGLDENRLPIPPHISAYKSVLRQYCVTLAKTAPIERMRIVHNVYYASVSLEHESETCAASKRKVAMYNAYRKIVVSVVPKQIAYDLLMKHCRARLPGYAAKKKVMMNMFKMGRGGQMIMKHPKSLVMELAQKTGVQPPTTHFKKNADGTHTALVRFRGSIIQMSSGNKKEAERKCFQGMCQQVFYSGVMQFEA